MAAYGHAHGGLPLASLLAQRLLQGGRSAIGGGGGEILASPAFQFIPKFAATKVADVHVTATRPLEYGDPSVGMAAVARLVGELQAPAFWAVYSVLSGLRGRSVRRGSSSGPCTGRCQEVHSCKGQVKACKHWSSSMLKLHMQQRLLKAMSHAV